jgi:hypothetical protein
VNNTLKKKNRGILSTQWEIHGRPFQMEFFFRLLTKTIYVFLGIFHKNIVSSERKTEGQISWTDCCLYMERYMCYPSFRLPS